MDCSNCTNKTCLLTKTPCKAIEKYLRFNGIRGQEWIRPQLPRNIRKKLKKNGEGMTQWREIPFSAFNYEDDDDI